MKIFKVERKAKIMNINNQVPHLTQDTIWKSDKNTRNHKSQKVNPFPASDHNDTRDRQDIIIKINVKHK